MNAVLLGGHLRERPSCRIVRRRLLVTCDLVMSQAPRSRTGKARDDLMVRVDAWGTQGEIIAALRDGDEFFCDGRLWAGRDGVPRVVAHWVTIIRCAAPPTVMQQPFEEDVVIIVDDELFIALPNESAVEPVGGGV